jgi:hypothetical protein
MLRALVLERMFGLFVIAQIVHIARWKRGGPPSDYLLWFVRFWLVLPTLCVAAWLAGGALYTGTFDPDELLCWFGALIGYGALCGAYVMIYPAISELSPSLEILRQLRDAPGHVLSIGAIKMTTVAGVHGLVHRLSNLQSSGLIVMRGGVFITTRKGRRIAVVVSAYRAMLGIKPGTGG